MQNLDKSLIQTIGGWQLTIAIILAQTRRAMNNLELASWTGLTDKTLARHLDKLDASGRIIRTTTGWMLTQGFQLELFSTLRVLSDTIPNTTPVVESEKFRLKSEKFRLESENLRLNEPLAVVVESKLNVSTITTTTTTTESEKFRLKNMAAFTSLKIYGRKAREVAELEWATPEYIRAHVESARSKTWLDNPDGFALTQMIEHVPAPEGNTREARKETPSRAYGMGAFAELIKHQNEDHDEHEGFCVWQGELDEVFEGGPYQGQHKRTPFCGKPLKSGSFRWCEEHHDINFESEEA